MTLHHAEDRQDVEGCDIRKLIFDVILSAMYLGLKIKTFSYRVWSVK